MDCLFVCGNSRSLRHREIYISGIDIFLQRIIAKLHESKLTHYQRYTREPIRARGQRDGKHRFGLEACEEVAITCRRSAIGRFTNY